MPETTAPGELPVHRVQCQIIEREPLNHDVTRVWLRLPAGKAIRWHAGQYLTLVLPHGEYPFSIANPPGGRDLSCTYATATTTAPPTRSWRTSTIRPR